MSRPSADRETIPDISTKTGRSAGKRPAQHGSQASEAWKAATCAVRRYGLCPNRVWALAANHDDGANILPQFFPLDDERLQSTFASQSYLDSQRREHASCTFDFCEQSQVNFTSISQRHESPSCNVDAWQRAVDKTKRDYPDFDWRKSSNKFVNHNKIHLPERNVDLCSKCGVIGHDAAGCTEPPLSDREQAFLAHLAKYLGPCRRVKHMFAREELDRSEDGLTAWHLYGRKLLPQGKGYMAISHVWADGTGAGTWPAGEVNQCLLHFFMDLARQHDCDGIWWDTICIPGEKVARIKAINNMHRNYENAKFTLVHDSFLRSISYQDPETFCVALVASPWFSRGWTALELAYSGRVMIAVTKNNRLDLVDLDHDLLHDPKTERHRIVKDMIQQLRQKKITDVDKLVQILGSRFTSWARDVSIISGLLAGIRIDSSQITEDEQLKVVYQEAIHKQILQAIGFVRHAHLFHNLPTVANGTGWCPAKLLSLPHSSSGSPGSTHVLKVDAAGNVHGRWKVVLVAESPEEFYETPNTHPMVELKIRSAFQDPKSHRCLVEPSLPQSKVCRTLLVHKPDESDVRPRYQLIGGLQISHRRRSTYEEMEGEEIDVVITSGDQTEWSSGNSDKQETDVAKAQGASQIEQEAKMRASLRTDNPGPRREIITQPSVKGIVERPLSSCVHDPSLFPVDGWPWNYGHCVFVPMEQRGIAALDPEMMRAVDVDERLLQAAKSGNMLSVNNFLQECSKMPKCQSIGYVDESGRSPISWAAGAGYTKVVTRLLDCFRVYILSEDQGQILRTSNTEVSKVDLRAEIFARHCNLMDENGRTALSWAAGEGRLQTVTTLLRYREIDIDLSDRDGWSPLWYAADRGQLAVMRSLLEIGAEVNLPDMQKSSLLRQIAAKGTADVAKLLLEKGALVHGLGVLTAAAHAGNTPVVQTLLSHGVHPDDSPDQSTTTPLWEAIRERHRDIVEILLRTKKVDVNYPQYMTENFNKKGGISSTPLMEAISVKHALFHAANVGKGKESERIIGDAVITQMLLDTKEVRINTAFWDGGTVLHSTAAGGDDAIVSKLLMVPGIDLDARDRNNATPLFRAASEGHASTVDLLLSTDQVDIGIKANAWVSNSNTWQKMTAEDIAKAKKFDEIARRLHGYQKSTKRSTRMERLFIN